MEGLYDRRPRPEQSHRMVIESVLALQGPGRQNHGRQPNGAVAPDRNRESSMLRRLLGAGLLVGAFAVYVLTSFYGEFRDYTHQRAAEKHQPAPAGKRP